MRNSIFFISLLLCMFSAPGFGASAPANDDSTKAKKIKTEYEVALMEGINTERSEFCAVSYSNGIAFVTDQLKDLVNNESTDANGFPYVDVFSAVVSNQAAEKISSFSKKINGPFHDGPVSFNAGQTRAYLTRVEYLNKAKNYVNRAKLLIFEKKDHGWSEPAAFKYNNDSYSTGHASVSASGHYLFFASDMPGGRGGKDLYVCRFNGTDWDKPENLGAEVNTDGDEEFPFIREDGVLFFSSNGHKGRGGYDIFSATTFNGKWRLRRNEGEEINSSGDDFGIVYTDSVHGYFSSNRKGGPGGDDIYRFRFSPMGTDVSATVLLTQNINDPAKNMLIYLLNAKGKRIDSTRTNQKGFFRFRNLYGEKMFMASVEPEDLFLQGKARFYLANSKGEIVRVSQQFKKGRFVFKNLPFDKTELREIYPDDDLTLSGRLTYSNNPTCSVKNARLFLVNSFGDVVDTAQTNELGYFVFKNLSPKQDYLVTISDTSLHLPAGEMVTLSDKSGRKLKSFVVGKDVFSFRLMSSEKSVLSELFTDDELSFDGSTCTYGEDKLVLKPKAYKKIYLIDGNGRVIDSVLTNRRGFFKFRNLDADLEYIASVSEDEADLAGKDYYLVNAQGHVVKVGYPFKKWKYAFRPIPADSFSLQEITPDNDVILAGNLRYGPKGADVLGRVRIYLTNANSVVVDSVVTNEYGCFSFRNLPADQNYMMSMNEADMKLPLNTKVILTDKNGKVVKVFYVGKDRFEYRVMSAEKNLLHDLETDDEDLVMKLNGFVLDHNKKAMGNVTLILFDSTGMQRQIIRTDSSGKFSFKNLKVGLTGHVEIITGDARDSVLFIADSKGRVYKKLRRNAGGKFEYKLLNVDEAAMGDFTVDDPWLKVVQMENKSDTLTIVERIFYATNDFKFDSVGQRVLDKTINVLKANSRLVIELGSHTDSRSNDTYNLKLSNERAQYAVEYIVSKGIDKSRLKAVGYGETRLLNKCSNNVKCSEKEHALNRRTEFRITTSGEATPLKTMK